MIKSGSLSEIRLCFKGYILRYLKEMEEYKQQKKNGIMDTTADSSDSE